MPPSRASKQTGPERQDPPDKTDDDIVIPGDDDEDADGDAANEPITKRDAEGGAHQHQGEAHPHRHTAGYPRHRHDGDSIWYDEEHTFAHGGPEAFPAERHDGDSEQAEGLEQDRLDHEDTTPENTAGKVVQFLKDDGWASTLEDTPVEANMPGGSIISLKKHGRTLVVTFAYAD